MADAEAMEVEEAQPAAADASKEADSSKAPAKRFEIKKWNAVAMWSWAICTDTCAICRNNLYEPSIEYQANPTGAHQLHVCWLWCPGGQAYILQQLPCCGYPALGGSFSIIYEDFSTRCRRSELLGALCASGWS